MVCGTQWKAVKFKANLNLNQAILAVKNACHMSVTCYYSIFFIFACLYTEFD